MKGKILILLLAGLFTASGWLLLYHAILNNPPEGIGTRQLIRFHVLANSDSEQDQQVKLKVRDAVIDYLAPYLENVSDIDHARAIVASRQGEIVNVARQVLKDSSMDYGVSIQTGYFDFPVKSYGNFVLPSGRYEAVRLLLGNAEGKNWWCVLFPPLCFIDVSSAAAVTKGDSAGTAELQPDNVELRWKIAEWFKEHQ